MPKARKTKADLSTAEPKIKDFLDMIAPGIIKFNTDHFICGNTYRCVWALREYRLPPMSRPSCGTWEKRTA